MSLEGIYNLESVPDAPPETWEKARHNVIAFMNSKGMISDLPEILDMLGMETV